MALLHLGGVRFPVTGPLRYTMTAREAIELCGLLRPRVAIPIHYEGWRTSARAVPRSSASSNARRRWCATPSAGCRSGSRSTSDGEASRTRAAGSPHRRTRSRLGRLPHEPIERMGDGLRRAGLRPRAARPPARDGGRRFLRRCAACARLAIRDERPGARAATVREIPLAEIRGTLEPDRARHFDADFRPAGAVRRRWESVWLAQQRGVALPRFRRRGLRRLCDPRGHHRVWWRRGAATILARIA